MPCYPMHAPKLKNLSIGACDSSYLIGPETKKYSKIFKSWSCAIRYGIFKVHLICIKIQI